MSSTMHIGDNCKGRKSLASQIDRLDTMLDGLADALPEVVADTIRTAAAEAVRDAVQAAITEVLTNPELLAKLRTAAQPAASEPQPAQKKPSVWQRLGQLCQRARTCLANLCRACGAELRRLWNGAGNVWRKTLRSLSSVCSYHQVLTQYKYQFFTALSVGVSVAAGAWFAGPQVSALLSGIGGFGMTLATQGWLWVRKALAFGRARMA